MDRRIVLAGLAAAFAAPALAQQSGASSTMQSGSAAGQAGAMRAGQMGQAEMQHMQQTMQLGQMALETSRLAQQKAKNENLKQFAQFEVEEQTTLAQILQSMMEPQTTSGTSQQGNAAPANMQMDAKSREMVQKLQQASADAFDKEYLQGQIQGHRDLLQVQERYLQSNSQNREHMAVARLARGRIQEHIVLLEDMQKIVK
jgi:putative membrane protein